MKSAALPALGITFLVLSLLLGIRIGQKQTPLSLHPAPSVSQNIYNNSKYAIRFEYPSGLTVEETPQGVNLTTASNNRIDFYVASDTSPNLGSYLSQLDKTTLTAYEGRPSRKIQSSRPVIVSGQDCTERQEYLIAADITRIVTYCKTGSSVYSIALTPAPGTGLSVDLAIYQQLLSTFRFMH